MPPNATHPRPTALAFASSFALALALAPLGCGPTLPPLSHVAAPRGPDERAAAVAVEWRASSCETAGYYTLMTGDGRFLGNVATGTRLVVTLPPGATEIVGWNPVMEEAASPAAPTAVLTRVDLRAGSTQAISLRFGEWDARGPRKLFRTRRFGQMCLDDRAVLLPVAAEDVAPLTTLEADRAAGQRSLDADGRPREHLAEARAWLERLAPGARARVAPTPP